MKRSQSRAHRADDECGYRGAKPDDRRSRSRARCGSVLLGIEWQQVAPGSTGDVLVPELLVEAMRVVALNPGGELNGLATTIGGGRFDRAHQRAADPVAAPVLGNDHG